MVTTKPNSTSSLWSNNRVLRFCFTPSLIRIHSSFDLSIDITKAPRKGMEIWEARYLVIATTIMAVCMTETNGIRFVIDREDCLSHNLEKDGNTNLHVSFVVIKADTPWHFADEGVDLLIKGPSGEHIQEIRDKTSEKFDFVASQKGLYRFCFTNKSPYHETIDFDVQAAHISHSDQHARDEHFAPLMKQIAKLEEALSNIQFEQHWIEAQTERQAIVNDNMSQRAIHKAMFESAALIGASALQVYLLQRLFERKLGLSRV